jgi:hypothetical protein
MKSKAYFSGENLHYVMRRARNLPQAAIRPSWGRGTKFNDAG